VLGARDGCGQSVTLPNGMPDTPSCERVVNLHGGVYQGREGEQEREGVIFNAPVRLQGGFLLARALPLEVSPALL
jgi:hypothetical protein